MAETPQHDLKRVLSDNWRAVGPVSDEVMEEMGYNSSGNLPAALRSLPKPEASSKRRRGSSDALDETGVRPTYLDSYEPLSDETKIVGKAGAEAARLALEQANIPKPKL